MPRYGKEIIYSVGKGFESDEHRKGTLNYGTISAIWDTDRYVHGCNLSEVRITSRVGDEILVGDIQALECLHQAIGEIIRQHELVERGTFFQVTALD